MYTTATGRVTSPTNFFQINILPGSNITITTNADYSITINSSGGGGGGSGMFSVSLDSVVTGNIVTGSGGVFSVSLDSVVTGNIKVQ